MIKRVLFSSVAFVLSLFTVLGGFSPLLWRSEGLELGASALYEPYAMTNEYKSGRFFENLSSLSLSGDEERDVLAIAMSQVGYHEGNSNSDMDGESREGNRDFTEYNVLYGKLDNSQGNGLSYGYYWCASFVNWCLRMAGVDEDASGGEVSCRRWYSDAKSMGIFKAKSGYIPSSADIIFFRDSGSTVDSTHIGLVRYSDGKYVYTVEGNTSSGNGYSSNGEYVALKKYLLSSSYIVGYASPSYEKNSTARKVDYSGGFLSLGEYICESDIAIYTDTQLTSPKNKRIPAFSVFEVTDIGDRSLMIRFDGQSGYINAEVPAVQLTSTENVYTVSYLSESGDTMYMPQYRREGERKSVYSNKPQKDKHGFVGWRLEAVPELIYAPGDRLPDQNSDMILVAVWDDNYYIVSFKKPDGTLVDQVHGYYGTEFEFPDALKAPEGYVFSGWDAGADGMITGNASYIASFILEEDFIAAGGETDTAPSVNGKASGCSSAISGVAAVIAALLMLPLVVRKNKK